jgi:hypothetical protein
MSYVRADEAKKATAKQQQQQFAHVRGEGLL